MNRYSGNGYSSLEVAKSKARLLADDSNGNSDRSFESIPNSMKFYGIQFHKGLYYVVEPFSLAECEEETIARYYYK
jgi:hypothetical protein